MTKEQKRENFKRIASKRTNKILNEIESLQNIAINKSYYNYEIEDIKAIFKAIEEQIEETKKTFFDPKRKQKTLLNFKPRENKRKRDIKR